MNAEDIRNITFDKVVRGYRAEEVDAYLARVSAEMELLEAEKTDNEKKLFLLAEKVDQYRNEEETLKTALLNAQRMGENVIHEARQKAETILHDATMKANQQKEEAVENVSSLEGEITRLKAEVAKFKCDILELYRQHIESLSAVPGDDTKVTRHANKKSNTTKRASFYPMEKAQEGDVLPKPAPKKQPKPKTATVEFAKPQQMQMLDDGFDAPTPSEFGFTAELASLPSIDFTTQFDATSQISQAIKMTKKGKKQRSNTAAFDIDIDDISPIGNEETDDADFDDYEGISFDN